MHLISQTHEGVWSAFLALALMWHLISYDFPIELLLGALSSYEATFPFDLECELVVSHKTNLPSVV